MNTQQKTTQPAIPDYPEPGFTRVSHTFAPVCDEHSEILILGSFPSVKSRENQFYYGHPQNRFWKLLARLFDEAVPTDISEKKSLLLRHGIALWDVISSCDIKGSSDSSIRNVVPCDLKQILDQAPIHTIIANGDTAFRLYNRYCEPQTGIAAVRCPSTSPANAVFTLDRLADEWGKYLCPQDSSHPLTPLHTDPAHAASPVHTYAHAHPHTHPHPHAHALTDVEADHAHEPALENIHVHSHTHCHKETKNELNRIAKIIGHMNAIKTMVESGRDCSEVLIQLAAVDAAIKSLSRVILKDHISTCIVDAAQHGDQTALEELNRAIDKFIK